ncbi:tetratricopeptide repeat protein [Pontibacter diazotrophicus]|uniref:Tetratricopeptide repeat protein n=1 Tax=Pontibacter diazotrophicus TaxID=1400979 RepID=A0A3D8LGP9_9BACT|nr:DUF6340 family protein [Pontibacter diazotrophicus]RDV16629.1 tetratricopeptide repeat protein [Pontibacter diazotrophicus]
MKTINAIWWCLCIFMALTQISCTSELLIERTLPAEVPVNNNQWKVVVMNRYNPELLPYKREKKIAVVYADGAMYALTGVLDAIDEDETYVLVATDTAGYTSVGNGSDLKPAQVQEIYHRHPHHLLLTLDNFDAYLEQEVVRETDEEGGVMKTAYYTMFVKSNWTLYDSTGTVLDSVTLSRDELYDTRAVISGLLALGPATDYTGPVVNDLAYQTGLDYWQRLAPQPVSIIRPYYSNNAFAPAAYQMAAGNWAEAIALLKPITEIQKKKEAARAAYNLAVVYEAMGRIEEAKYWANIASDKNNKLALMLLPDLDRY